MRILPLHPVSEYNIGDLMTYYGSMYLMRKALGNDIEFLHFDTRRAEAELDTYVSGYNWGDVDVVLLCGSPFLGVNRDDTKVKMLRQAQNRYGTARFIALGIGSSFRHNNIFYNNYFDYSDRNCDSNSTAISITQELFGKFDLVIARDPYTYGLLQLAGIKSSHYFDTALYAVDMIDKRYQEKKEDKYYVFTNPLTIDCFAHVPDSIWKYVNAWQLKMANKHNIIVVTSQDKAYLDSMNIESQFVTDIRYLNYMFSHAKEVISARVHLAIYAKSVGVKNVSVVPFDCRYISALNFGCDVLFPDIDMRNFPQHATDYRLKSVNNGNKKLFRDKYDGTLNFDFNKHINYRSYDGFYIEKIKEGLK